MPLPVIPNVSAWQQNTSFTRPTSIPHTMRTSSSPCSAYKNRRTMTIGRKSPTNATQTQTRCVLHQQGSTSYTDPILGALPNTPAAVYLGTPLGKCHQIMTNQVAKFLCHMVHKVLSIPEDHQDLRTWSCHSSQVTAANLLHHE